MHILRLLAILLALVADIVEGITNSESKKGVESSQQLKFLVTFHVSGLVAFVPLPLSSVFLLEPVYVSRIPVLLLNHLLSVIVLHMIDAKLVFLLLLKLFDKVLILLFD